MNRLRGDAENMTIFDAATDLPKTELDMILRVRNSQDAAILSQQLFLSKQNQESRISEGEG